MAIREKSMTLEEFLRWPRIDRKPYLEYIDGEVVAKASPQGKHSFIQDDFLTVFNGYARPRKLGRAVAELRFTFAGRSILPDVAFILSEHIIRDDRGEIAEVIPTPPDIHVEIMSPEKRLKRTRDKLVHSTANGCPIGILVHPYRKWIEVYRNGTAEVLAPDGTIDFAPTLPGFRIGVAEVFHWLKNPV